MIAHGSSHNCHTQSRKKNFLSFYNLEETKFDEKRTLPGAAGFSDSFVGIPGEINGGNLMVCGGDYFVQHVFHTELQ